MSEVSPTAINLLPTTGNCCGSAEPEMVEDIETDVSHHKEESKENVYNDKYNDSIVVNKSYYNNEIYTVEICNEKKWHKVTRFSP